MATLATVKGDNRTLVENVPADVVDPQSNLGKIRVLYDTYTVGAGNNFGTSGLIRLFNIPKNARLIDFEVTCGDCGTTGAFDIGWAASRTLDDSGTAVEAASSAGIIAAVDCHTAAVTRKQMIGTVAGYMKKFLAEVEVQADFSAATDAAAGKVFHFVARVVID